MIIQQHKTNIKENSSKIEEIELKLNELDKKLCEFTQDGVVTDDEKEEMHQYVTEIQSAITIIKHRSSALSLVLLISSIVQFGELLMEVFKSWK